MSVIAKLSGVIVGTALVVAGAGAASPAKSCGVPTADAIYETPAVQIYTKRLNREHTSVIACIRATGRTRAVDSDEDNGFGDTGINLNRVIDGRFVWLQENSTAAATLDQTVADRLVDLSTGASASETTFESDSDGEGTSSSSSAVAAPGALLSDDGEVDADVLATHKQVTLDADKDDKATRELAASAHTAYWLHGSTTMSAPIPGAPASRAVPATRLVTPTVSQASAAAKTKPRDRCDVAHAMTLLLAHDGGLRVYRAAGGPPTACLRSSGKTTVLTKVLPGVTATGAPTELDDMAGANGSGPSDVGEIRYGFRATKAGKAVEALVILNVATGHVVLSALAPTPTADWLAGLSPAPSVKGKETEVLAYSAGESLTLVDRWGSHDLATGAISELALSPDLSDSVNDDEHGPTGRLYWTADGTPASAATGVAPAS